MPKNPYNSLLIDHILIFWVLNSSYLPLLKEGTTAEFAAPVSSHNRPCALLLCHNDYYIIIVSTRKLEYSWGITTGH